MTRVAIITGSAQGIGRAIALAFAMKKIDLVLADFQTKKLKQVVKELRKTHQNIIGIRTDVRKERDVERLVNMAIKKFGRIDFLINNAGIAISKPLTEILWKEWKNIIDTNLNGMFLCCKYSILKMERNGVIVNISSGLGKRGLKNFSAYCASKFGVIGLTESMAEEIKDKGIRAYALCPGGVDTEMHRNLFPNEDPKQLLKPEDVARKVITLCFEGFLFKSGSSVEV